MAKIRFLNVQYGCQPDRIKVSDMEDLSELREKIKEKYELTRGSAYIQLWEKTDKEETLISTWKQLNSLFEYYFEEESGFFLTIVLLPKLCPSTAEDIELKSRKRKRIRISDLTIQLQSFANVQLVHGCLHSLNGEFLPYPQSTINKLYIRKCYEDIFALILKNIKSKSFAIAGTSGIGKSVFFIYILYRLMKDISDKSLPLKASRIVYQSATEYICFNLESLTVVELEPFEAKKLLQKQDTIYFIDGQAIPLLSSCITMFISSPRSDGYKGFVTKKMAKEWYFPVWTLEELQSCQTHCYPNLSIELFNERYRICGGVAGFVFQADYNIPVPKPMTSALYDVKAVRGVKYVAEASSIYPESHSLVHILVGDDEYGNAYQFIDMDIASIYVGEKLWNRHSAQMAKNLQEMFDSIPNNISRHLFEIYGRMVFAIGGQRIVNSRCLEKEDAIVSKIPLHATYVEFGKGTIRTAAVLQGCYYEPKCKKNLPSVLSIFQFTVAAEHDNGGVVTIENLSKLDNEPKLYFVVPSHQFEKFKKQNIKIKQGTNEAESVARLQQYVLELPADSQAFEFGYEGE